MIKRKAFIISFEPDGIDQNWNSTDNLIESYVNDMRLVSGNQVEYEIGQKIVVPYYPKLLAENQYDQDLYVSTLQNSSLAILGDDGRYAMADYEKILFDFGMLHRINSYNCDEVWMFGGPYFGFYESRMVGRDAIWCNAPALKINSRTFVMMGFSYERGVREMLHNFGHRAESILYKSDYREDYENWVEEYGTVHRVPGGEDYSQDEYEWLRNLKQEWWQNLVIVDKAIEKPVEKSVCDLAKVIYKILKGRRIV